jgi:hypothetical protein
MAIELLMGGKNVTHSPSHDLESLFYVLVFICTNLEGPNTPRTLQDLLKFSSLPIAAWFIPETSFVSLATTKLGIGFAFERRIVDRFSPYFTDIKPCVMELFNAMYPHGPQIKSSLTHDRMIEIFTATLERLPSRDQYLPETQNVVPEKTFSRKRSLCIYDNCVFLSEKKRRTKLFNRAGFSSSTSGLASTSTSGLTSRAPRYRYPPTTKSNRTRAHLTPAHPPP